jgi:bifunctional UDP-N-acetylglucosamine pyrophosphorylase/glucosamine-1-phosphate N-acetyltransferase
METELTIVILAAGLGTRMKSAKAKVLHSVGGKTLIEHVVGTALQLTSPERVFVVVGHQADRVREVLTGRGTGFIEQREQKGTGHALLAGREALEPQGGRLMVLYGDCPLIPAGTLRRLLLEQRQSGASAAIITALLDDPTGYGRILLDPHGNVRAIVEQKSATPEQLLVREINSGIYCFDAADFWSHADQIHPGNPAKEYYLTDIVEILNRAGRSIHPMRIADPAEVLGINNRIELAQVDAVFRARKVDELMLAGVTIEKPETVTVDVDVRIGLDTVIEPFTRLLGATSIGSECRIGACSILEDATLGDRVQVGAFTSIAASRLDNDAHAGPYARLRMGAHAAPAAHIGNFVELKKTRLGPRSKAMHLAYLGDSEIGEGVNIGAGTITCNYDGAAKHATTIGDGAFVGSNATLVAPIVVGAGSYLGAGSVITKTVPPDALALGRARQTIKEDWAKKRRKAQHG